MRSRCGCRSRCRLGGCDWRRLHGRRPHFGSDLADFLPDRFDARIGFRPRQVSVLDRFPGSQGIFETPRFLKNLRITFVELEWTAVHARDLEGLFDLRRRNIQLSTVDQDLCKKATHLAVVEMALVALLQVVDRAIVLARLERYAARLHVVGGILEQLDHLLGLFETLVALESVLIIVCGLVGTRSVLR